MILFNELFQFLPQEEFYAEQCVEHLDRDIGTRRAQTNKETN
jgi:hypothetical protein